jgi:hypothetical protein
LTEARRDIAFETTLASQLLLPRMRAMQAAGYRFHLFFFWLPNADVAVQRVAARVASGGHNIPEDVIRRRYERGLENFFNHYSAVADSWVFADNTDRPPRRIAWREIGDSVRIGDNPLWRQLTTRYMKPRVEEQQPAAGAEQTWTSQDIIDAIDRAVRAALKRHKERGESVVVWRNGRIVTLRPEEIDV